VVQICSLLRGGIAERGGVRVGHRIIEINNQSVVAVPHEKIVNLLATSVGEVSKRAFILSVFMKFQRSKYFQAVRFIF
jgi:C-terminal processing protease CtpA/Prc